MLLNKLKRKALAEVDSYNFQVFSDPCHCQQTQHDLLEMAPFGTSTARPYHIIIFGASGFTGQFVVEEVARTASEGPGGGLRWAVAGRSRSKLEKVIEQAAVALSKPELKSEVEVIVADVCDQDSLAAMCKQAVIVLSCVGPYRFFGEPVVKTCVENGAHCIDISGEPQVIQLL
ncbi:hypothetical protein DNTS_029334 [Danionella cerebrum]|uniref:Saccharopine dehydrogenase-like oxidoreductase n=1 Tax=Danionella cerebrum TaxID=2873325 RepID=A0A553NK36_9TELE|nr:hypothetical protein DNTS_029334 [Danionella translucida]